MQSNSSKRKKEIYKKWYAEKKEIIKKKNIAWYRFNKEKCSKKRKETYIINKEKVAIKRQSPEEKEKYYESKKTGL